MKSKFCPSSLDQACMVYGNDMEIISKYSIILIKEINKEYGLDIVNTNLYQLCKKENRIKSTQMLITDKAAESIIDIVIPNSSINSSNEHLQSRSEKLIIKPSKEINFVDQILLSTFGQKSNNLLNSTHMITSTSDVKISNIVALPSGPISSDPISSSKIVSHIQSRSSVEVDSILEELESPINTDSIILDNFKRRLYQQYLINGKKIKYQYITNSPSNAVNNPNLKLIQDFLDQYCYYRPEIIINCKDLWTYCNQNCWQISQDDFYLLMNFFIDNVKISIKQIGIGRFYLGINLVDNFELIKPDISLEIYSNDNNKGLISFLRHFIYQNMTFKLDVDLKYKIFIDQFRKWYRLTVGTHLGLSDHVIYTVCDSLSNEFPYVTDRKKERKFIGMTLL